MQLHLRQKNCDRKCLNFTSFFGLHHRVRMKTASVIGDVETTPLLARFCKHAVVAYRCAVCGAAATVIQ